MDCPPGFKFYHLPHHDIRDGKLVTARGGVIAAGNALQGSRGGVKIPDEEVGAVKAHLKKHYAQFDLTAPWDDDKSTSAPVGACKEKPMATTKDDDMESVTCPSCGEAFKPEKAKKHLDEMKEREALADARVKSAESAAEIRVNAAEAERNEKQTALETVRAALGVEKLADAPGAAERLVKELAAARTELVTLQINHDLDPLVGTKVAPATKDGHVEVGKLFLAQGEAGKARWKTHLECLAAQADLPQRTGGSTLEKEPEGAAHQRSADDDGGAELGGLVNQLAAKSADAA